MDQANRVMIYKIKSWASSIMGPSRVVFYEVKNWVSSIMGTSLITMVMNMWGARRSLRMFALLSANPWVNVPQNLTSHVHVQDGVLLTRQNNFPCQLQRAISQH